MGTLTMTADHATGVALLADTARNKGTAFSLEERKAFGLEGCSRRPSRPSTGSSSARA